MFSDDAPDQWPTAGLNGEPGKGFFSADGQHGRFLLPVEAKRTLPNIVGREWEFAGFLVGSRYCLPRGVQVRVRRTVIERPEGILLQLEAV